MRVRKDIDWQTGEVSFDHGGRRWLMTFNFRAYSKSPGLIDGKPAEVTPSTVRRLMGLALAKHHPALTSEDVGGLIEALGFECARRLVRDAIEASQGHPWTNYWRNLRPGDPSQAPGAI